MPLPNNFNNWKHFLSVWRRTHNQEVREYFRDVGEDNWNPDINTPRGSLRVACTMDNNDTGSQCIARWLFFHGTVKRWDAFNEPVYGIPVGVYHETRRFKPQVRLFFKEDLDDVELGYHPLKGEICFRLMGESTDTVTKSYLTRLGNQIKLEFGAGNGYRWHKGKMLCSYNEPERGYKLQIYAFSKSDGKEIISKVLSIRDHTPDWKFLTINENEEASQAYPTIPPMQRILNENVRLPRRRPSGYVRFHYATCSIWGKSKPVPLYDRTYRFFDALVEAS